MVVPPGTIAHALPKYSPVTSEFCAGCHEYTNDRGIPIFSTYSEWKTSPQAAEGKTCLKCHMPQAAGQTVRPGLGKDRKVLKSIDQFISEERQATAMATGSEFVVEEKTLAPMFVAGVRMKGHYSECGKSFGRICRSFGRYAAGKPMMLHYDTEYKEADADFVEAQMRINPPVDPMFRVGEIGLGYDQVRDRVVLFDLAPAGSLGIHLPAAAPLSDTETITSTPIATPSITTTDQLHDLIVLAAQLQAPIVTIGSFRGRLA